MSKCTAAVSSCTRLNSDCSGRLNPFPRSQVKAVLTRLGLKGLEFVTFKMWIMNLLPNSQILNGVSVPHPAVDERIVAKVFGHVSERNELSRTLANDPEGCSLNSTFGIPLVEELRGLGTRRKLGAPVAPSEVGAR